MVDWLARQCVGGDNAAEREAVDVIIPSWKPGEKFLRLLSMLEKQTWPVGKIIVMNTEKAFFPAAATAFHKIEVHHISKDQFDHGGTRNAGVSYSRAPYFLMMTDDAVPRDRFLIERMVGAMKSDKRIGAVYARQLATRESGFDERIARIFNYPPRSVTKDSGDLPALGIRAYFQSNVCCLYRRDVFEQVGGFLPHAIFNEDMVYCASMLRLGYASRYAADAKVYHAHRYTGFQQFRRNFDLGVSQAQHPEVFEGIPSEGEGLRLVRRSVYIILKKGRFRLLPVLFWRCACKYAGYVLGKHYKSLPAFLPGFLSMNRSYWKKKRNKKEG